MAQIAQTQTQNDPKTYIQTLRGTFTLVGGGLIVQIISGLTGIIIARSLGVSGYGEYAAAFTMVTAFDNAFLLGLDTLVVRDVAQKHEIARSLFNKIILPITGWTILLAFVIFLISHLVGYSASIKGLIVVLGLMDAVRALSTMNRAFCRGLQKMSMDISIQLIATSLGLVLVIAFFYLYRTVLGVACAVFVAEIITFCIGIQLVRKITGQNVLTESPSFFKNIQTSIPLGITITLIALNQRVDMLSLPLLVPTAEVGVYAAALGCYLLSRPITLLISSSLLPSLSEIASTGSVAGQKFIEKAFRYNLIIGLIIGAYTSALAPFLIELFYGPKFMKGSGPLQWLGFVAALLAINTFLWHILIAYRKVKMIAISGFISFGTILILSFILVPRFGITGAAMAALGREVSMLLMLIYFVRRIGIRFEFQKIALSFLAAMFVCFLTWIIYAQLKYLGLFFVLFTFGIYFLLLILMKVITRDELMIFYNAFKFWDKGKNEG